MNKWSDPKYHILECMRELSAAENHLVQYIKSKSEEQELIEYLEYVRSFRKKIEEALLGG